MKLKWLGHSCFLITSREGLRIVTDPYAVGSGISYAPVNESADIVTVSHDHGDHSNVSSLRGTPELVKGSGVKSVRGIEFRGIATYHDGAQGKHRGHNTLFCFEVDGVRVCHCGDLGHLLSPAQASDVGAVDLLLVPVGGTFTIDAAEASELCSQLRPRVVVPMHFKTPKCDYPIAGVESFLEGKKNVESAEASEREFDAEKLPGATRIVVLEPAL